MNIRHLLVPLGLVATFSVLSVFVETEAEPESETVWRIIAYQSYDNRIWEILGVRDSNGVIADTVTISPPGLQNFSEPIIMGRDSLLFCAMLAHRQVVADSAYILVRKSTDFGANWNTLATIGANRTIPRHLRAAYDPDSSVIHLVWEDCRSGFWRIYYEKINSL